MSLTRDDYKRAAANGVSAALLCKRQGLGWDLERAVTQPPKAAPAISPEIKQLKQIAQDNGIPVSTFGWRVGAGWDHNRAATEPVRAWERLY